MCSSLNELLGWSCQVPTTGGTLQVELAPRSQHWACGAQASLGTGPRFAMRFLPGWQLSLLPVDFLQAHLSLGTAVGFPTSSTGSLGGLSEHLGCFQELWQLPRLLCRSTAPQCSRLLCSCIAFGLEGGLLGCFCFARKDFSAHLHRYLSLALKQEARYRQLLLQLWGWVRLSARERGLWKGFWGTVLWGEVWGRHRTLVP